MNFRVQIIYTFISDQIIILLVLENRLLEKKDSV